MDRETFPIPEFTREELDFLQDIATRQRAKAFDTYMAALEAGEPSEHLYREYQLAKEIRTKVYHLNGRDTLAPGNHRVRWWDQQHDYH